MKGMWRDAFYEFLAGLGKACLFLVLAFCVAWLVWQFLEPIITGVK